MMFWAKPHSTPTTLLSVFSRFVMWPMFVLAIATLAAAHAHAAQSVQKVQDVPVITPAPPPELTPQAADAYTPTAAANDDDDYTPPPREPITLDKDQLDAAHAEVKRDTSIQFALPDVPKPKVEKKREPGPEFSWEWLEALAPILRILFWVMVAGLALYLIYRLIPAVRDWVDLRFRRAKPEVEEEDSDDWIEERTVARHLLKEADALARDGNYAEAAHLLLWRSIEDIENRRPALIKRDWTAREIAAAQGLPGAARDAFAAIARTVEISLFGKRPVNADGWAACRDAYARFALGTSWQERAA